MTLKPYVTYTTEVPTTASQIIARIAEERSKEMRNMTVEQYRESQKLLADARNTIVGVNITPVTYYNVPCEWVYPRLFNQKKNEIIIYYHGGSWMFGSIETARPIAVILSRSCGIPVLIVNYRLAPEHQYPAGFFDCYNVYKQVVESGFSPSKIGLFGDSAGGNLSLAVINRLKEEGSKLPACLALASPVTSIETSSAIVSSEDNLIYINYDNKEWDIFSLYLGSDYSSKRHLPSVSPINGDLNNLPPILIHSGETEPITKDNIDFAEKVYNLGGDILVKVWKDMFHDFTVVGRTLRESRLSINEIAAFFKKHLF